MNPLLRTEIMSPDFELACKRVFLDINIFSTDETILGKFSCSLLSAALAQGFVVDTEPTMLASRAFGDYSQTLYDEIADHEPFLKEYILNLEDSPRLWRWWAEGKLYTFDGKLAEIDEYNSDYELEQKILPEASSNEFASLIIEVCDAHNPKTWSDAGLAEIGYSTN